MRKPLARPWSEWLIVLSRDTYPVPERIELQRALEELGAKVEYAKLNDGE